MPSGTPPRRPWGSWRGFTVERIVNEPTAAALAYGLDKLKEHSRVAVYDLWAAARSILSILELNGGVFQALHARRDTRLGVTTWTSACSIFSSTASSGRRP